MTNLIKRKGLLSLMAVVVMIAMLSVACKNKVTQPASFSVAEDIEAEEPAISGKTAEEPTNPEQPAEEPAVSEQPLTPDGQLNIDKNKGSQQYVGKYFESKTYQKEDGTKFKYTIEIKDLKDGRNGTALIFTDADNGGKQYNFPGFFKDRGDSYYNYNEGGSGVLNDGISAANTLKVRFYNDNNGGWANVQPAGYNFTIKLALKNK